MSLADWILESNRLHNDPPPRHTNAATGLPAFSYSDTHFSCLFPFPGKLFKCQKSKECLTFFIIRMAMMMMMMTMMMMMMMTVMMMSHSRKRAQGLAQLPRRVSLRLFSASYTQNTQYSTIQQLPKYTLQYTQKYTSQYT